MFAVLLAALTLAVAQAAPTDAYRIGPYDVLEIVVPEERPDAPMVMTEALTVGPDGIIGVAYLGSIVAEGKTTAELSEEIRMGLIEAGQFVNPHVLVRVQEYGADRVSVLGAVAEPGYFPFREGLAVRDAVAMANGVLMGIAANTTARVVHRDGTSASFKLNEALRGEGAMADFILQPGDALIVEESAPASVLGYVHSPGDLRVREGARLSEVISLAGGIVESGELTYQSGRTPGDSSRITINRADGTTETVSLMGPDEGTTRDDPPVFPGDVIYVPASRSEVTVLGYVMGPGVLVFRSGDRVSDAIAKAGGVVVSTGVPDNVMEIGDLSAIRLYRADGTEQLVDLDSRVAGTGDPELLPGDSIVVPRREQTYYALGHVRTQGRHVLPPGSRVLDLYTAAGGAMTADALPMRTTDADLANCVLARADGTQLVVDLQAIAQDPALETNVELVHGDSLWVPEADRRVIVAGYVQSPGYFQFREGDTASPWEPNCSSTASRNAAPGSAPSLATEAARGVGSGGRGRTWPANSGCTASTTRAMIAARMIFSRPGRPANGAPRTGIGCATSTASKYRCWAFSTPRWPSGATATSTRSSFSTNCTASTRPRPTSSGAASSPTRFWPRFCTRRG